MSENQPLPVQVQLVRRAGGGKAQPASPLPRLQQQVYLGIVAQGLEVAYPLHWARDRLPVNDGSSSEGHLHPEPLPDQTGHHLQLYLAHKSEMYLSQSLVPHHPELGVLLL